MRNVIKWVGLPFRVAFFLTAFVLLLLPGMVLVGFFSGDGAGEMWDSARSLGKWALSYDMDSPGI